MTRQSSFSGLLRKPFRWMVSRWHHHWMWTIQHSLFKIRHYRRLVRLAALLILFTIAWCVLVIGLVFLLGGARLMLQEAFIQNVLASLLVLPIGLAIGIVVATLLEKHSLRFKVRHAGDKLADGVSLATLKLIVYLERECRLPIEIAGPIDHRFVERAREVVQRQCVASGWSLSFPAGLEPELNKTVNALVESFRSLPELQIAFPRSFEILDNLESLMDSIKVGTSKSSPINTTLIVLAYTAQMLDDLK